MSQLFRLLRVAERELDSLKITKALEKAGEEFGLHELAPITRNSENVLHIGDRTAESLETSLKAGRIEEAISHIYHVKDVPESVKLKLLDQVKDLPSARVAAVEAKSAKVKSILKTAFEETPDIKDLADVDGPPLTVQQVQKNSNLIKTLDVLKASRIVSAYTGIVVIGGTTALIVAAINAHRKEMRGCYRFTNTNGTIHSCKIVESSCVDGAVDLHETIRACTNLSADFNDLGVGDCSKIVGVGCINCPPEHLKKIVSKDTEKIDKPETYAKQDASDLVSYHCNQPSVLDAMSDLLNERAGDVSRALGDIGGTVGKAVKTAFDVVTILFIVMGAVVGIVIIAYGVKKLSIISKDGKSKIIVPMQQY